MRKKSLHIIQREEKQEEKKSHVVSNKPDTKVAT